MVTCWHLPALTSSQGIDLDKSRPRRETAEHPKDSFEQLPQRFAALLRFMARLRRLCIVTVMGRQDSP
jgi:hypothetical protein